MLFMLPGTTKRRTASKFLRDSSSFHIVRPGGSGCSRSGVPDAWHEMQRACPARLARKIGCTCVLNISKSSVPVAGLWLAHAPKSSVSTMGIFSMKPPAACRSPERLALLFVKGLALLRERLALRLPRDGVRVDAGIGAGAEHAGFGIDDDRGQRAHRPRAGHAQLVST